MNTAPRGGKPSQPASPTTETIAWAGPEWMGLALGLALLAFYRASFADGTTTGIISNFLELKWATAALAAGLWGLLLAARRLAPAPVALTWIDALVALLVAWAAISLAWTPDLAAAALSGLFGDIALLFYVLGRCTAAEDLRRILRIAILPIIVGSLATGLLLGKAVDLGFGNENFAAETLVLCICVLPVVWTLESCRLTWLAAGAAGLAAAYLLLLAPSNLQYLALLGVLWYLAVQRLPARAGWALSILLAVMAVVLAVVWTGDGFAARFAQLPEGWRERPQTWANVAAAGAEAPLWGHGWGSFYTVYADYIDRYLSFLPILGLPVFDSFDRTAGAAHNELLEIWFSLGLPGLLLAVATAILALATALRATHGSPTRWAGAGLVAWLAIAMIEFPGQNAATAILGLLFLNLVAPAALRIRVSPLRADIRPVFLILSVSGIALASGAWQQTAAQNRFAAADLLHKSQRLAPAAEGIVRSLEISDLAPKLRLRLFPQSVVAGPAYWAQVGAAEMERRYAISASSAPGHPVLVDLRLKYLLSAGTPASDEIETLLAGLKTNSGISNANAHVLDAAWALRIGAVERAQASLALAEARLASNPKAVSAQTNATNIAALRRQLGAAPR